jgi:hypothetical protein
MKEGALIKIIQGITRILRCLLSVLLFVGGSILGAMIAISAVFVNSLENSHSLNYLWVAGLILLTFFSYFFVLLFLCVVIYPVSNKTKTMKYLVNKIFFDRPK